MSVHKNLKIMFVLLFVVLSLSLISANLYAESKPKMKALAQVKKPTLSERGVVSWTNVVNAKKYNIQLYKNGLIFGAIYTATDGKTGYNLLRDMRTAGIGSYTVTVMAKGDGTVFKDGQQSALSNSQTISKAAVSEVILSGEGIATWKSKNSTSDELNFYKSKKRIDTMKGISPGCDLKEIMRNNGEGIYYITVTPRSAAGLFIDGESAESNLQVVGPTNTFNGTVENTFEPLAFADKSRNDIVITKVKPDKGLESGEETKITVEIEYSLVTQDTAALVVYSNWGSDPAIPLESTNCDVYKGNGKIRFIFRILPKKWDNGQKFWIKAALRDGDTRRIVQTRNYNLDVAEPKQVQGSSVHSDSNNKTLPQNNNEPVKLADLLVKTGVTVDRDQLAYLLYIDHYLLPSFMQSLAKYSYFSTDTISDEMILHNAAALKNDRLKIYSYSENFGFGRIEESEQKYFVVLFYDDRLNLIGYYVYEASEN